MAQPRGPRGEKVTVITWVDPTSSPHIMRVEAYASAGVRPGSHTSAKDRVLELEREGMIGIGTETVTVR